MRLKLFVSELWFSAPPVNECSFLFILTNRAFEAIILIAGQGDDAEVQLECSLQLTLLSS